jgi:1-hydroxycarotenoid 3,4-desaturase
VQGDRVVVIGAGIGGLVSALLLAVHGFDVTVLERAATPGGKMREVEVAGRKMDAGPTVFTMRPVFEQIFAEAGAKLADYVSLTPLSLLARHAWDEAPGLDLFADREQSAAAIGDFAGAEAARQYLAFCARSRDMFETLNTSFMQVERPSQLGLVARAGLAATWRTSPFSSMWSALGRSFSDARLRQLFARYATYCGSSPFAAPATLMLVAHVEQEGVWAVEGGMHRLAQALKSLCEARGVRFRFNADVTGIECEHARVSGVRLASGHIIPADAVILNGDAQALTAGLFGVTAKAVVGAHLAYGGQAQGL